MRERPHIIPALVAGGLLFAALLQLPYGYYQMLRWVVCGISIYIAYKAYKCDKKWAIWVFVVCAILFNPIAPIGFSREIWRSIDIVFGILFIISIAVLRQPTEVADTSPTQADEDKEVKQAPNYCPNCGHKLDEPSNYCPNCGREIV